MTRARPDSKLEGTAARLRAIQEQRRADHAAQKARRHEALALDGVLFLQEFHQRMAATHRQAERMHRAAAQMQHAVADLLSRRVRTSAESRVRAAFMAVVANAVATESAAVVLHGGDGTEAVATTSDDTARAAQDLEFVFCEGPAHDAASSCRLVAVGAELERRWPHYGPAVADLGVRAVVAAPLRTNGGCLGAVVAFNPANEVGDADLQTVADALLQMIVFAPALAAGAAHGRPRAAWADRDTVHVAAGALAVRRRCDVADALALIRARAFADGVPAHQVARAIVCGDLDLG